MKRWSAIPVLLLAAALSLGGCSRREDLSKRAIVTAVAVSRKEDGEYKVRTESLSHLGSEEKSWESRTGTGETFAQAVTNLELAAGKSLYLDGCRVLLLDGFADRGELETLLEEIDSHGGVRPLTLVAISPGLSALPEEDEQEESAGEMIFSLLAGRELTQVNLKDCLNLLETPGRGLLIPMVEREKGETQVSGYLSPGSIGLLKVPAGAGRLLPFAEPETERVYTTVGEGYSADWVLEKSAIKLRPRVEEGEVSFLLEAKVEGYLLSGRGEIGGEKLLHEAQEDICRQLLEEYAYVLEKISRASGNDLFSMGKHLELMEGKTWQQVGEDWEERLPEIPVELRGSVLLRDKKRIDRQS